ncbi:MAG TPA: sugar phosphate isomerase/epimerase family protein [Bryobacteraceae bacterium]|nr:sugar phosphate isomerase/epimerase family protein [Bryobacteraceae bacterium]
MNNQTRRGFLGAGGAVAASLLTPLRSFAAGIGKSPFRIAVINDEISQDLDHACHVAANEFGLEWIELRSFWKKNILTLDDNELAEAKRTVDKYKLRVTDIASPLFKVDWKGAPKSKFSPKRDEFKASFGFDQQDEVLDRSIRLAKGFNTERIRCFDFWRLDDQAPYRSEINSVLRHAAEKVAKQKLLLVLENEMACNTATGPEAAKVLAAIKSPSFMLNWDPGNAAAAGEAKPYPDGYALLPKSRIGHCHVKSAFTEPNGKYKWAPVGKGVVDWVGQFRALKNDGYHYAVSLETHWRGAGTPEASTRISFAGMKKCLQDAGALT